MLLIIASHQESSTRKKSISGCGELSLPAKVLTDGTFYSGLQFGITRMAGEDFEVLHRLMDESKGLWICAAEYNGGVPPVREVRSRGCLLNAMTSGRCLRVCQLHCQLIPVAVVKKY